MAFTAATVFQLVCLVTWTVLSTTPNNEKHTVFAQFFTSLASIESTASTASLSFAIGLFEVLQATAPPTIWFFKGLPTKSSSSLKDLWVLYALVLEKNGCRPKIYIGSATSASGGARQRFQQYDLGLLIPRYVQDAFDAGYTITHKGLLCWIARPSAALVPVSRLLFLALEAAFAYIFWAMRSRTRHWGMGHICFWDRHTLEYDGLCSHCSLNEGIHGDFDLSAEQLEAQAVDKENKRLKMKADNATNHHHKQMETNYADYIDNAIGRKMKSRALNPDLDRKAETARNAKARAEKSFHCVRCDLSFTRQTVLEDHYKTEKHIRKEHEHNNPFRCGPCNIGYANQSNLTRHYKSDRHIANVAAAQPGLGLD